MIQAQLAQHRRGNSTRNAFLHVVDDFGPDHNDLVVPVVITLSQNLRLFSLSKPHTSENLTFLQE